MIKNILENLELKLSQTRLENSEKLDKYELEYKKEYSDFFDTIFQNDNLWFKRYISVNFQLKKLNNPWKANKELLEKSINEALEILPITKEKKEILKTKLFFLEKDKQKIDKIFIKNSNLFYNKNFPILEWLEKAWFLTQDDILKVSLKFKETSNFLDSIYILDNNKFELIKSNYFDLNDTNSKDRIDNFENDFSSEIKESQNIRIYPKVIKLIWKNYFKLRLKNKVESKKERLRRTFKILFLKLYRLKYSWIDITSVLKKIDTLDDLDSFINLLIKFFEQLKQNPNLQKDYIVSDEIDEISEIWTQAEENKDKLLFWEEKTLEISKILEKNDKTIEESSLEEIMWEDVDLVWNKFIKRTTLDDNSLQQKIWINTWVLYDWNYQIEDEEEELEKEEIDLEEYYDELKKQFDELEQKKKNMFLVWNYDNIDIINEELLELLVKLEKIWTLLWNK